MIENVFRIVNPPTNSAMNANTSNAVLKKPNAELILLVCSLTTVWPVTTSTSRGSTAAIDRCTAALSAPGLATMSMESNWPTSPISACAVGMSNAASVAPARLSAVPNFAMPVMVNVCVGPCNKIRTRSPTENPYFCAVPQVHHHVVRRRWLAPLHQVQGRDVLVGVERQSERRRRTGADGLAVVADELRVAGHRALGLGHARHRAHRRQQRLRHRVARRVPAVPNCATPRTWKSMFW